VPTRFDRDTAVTKDGAGRYLARVDEGWWITQGPNGGYLAAILLRAVSEEVGGGRTPLSLTVQYLRPPAVGDLVVEVTIEREGRSVANVSLRAFQNDALVAFGQAALSTPRPAGIEFDDLEMPDLPPPGECPLWPPPGVPSVVPINDRYETRWAIGSPPGEGATEALAGGWIRTEDARHVDDLLVAALADAWVPPVFSKFEMAAVAVPTVELTVYFRGGLPRPEGEYVLARFRSAVAAGGFVEEDGELWSEDGVLLAQSRQISAVVGVAG